MSIPNGHFIDGMIYFGTSVVKGEVRVAKGFKISPMYLEGASANTKNEFHQTCEQLLTSLGMQYEMSIDWDCDSDFGSEINDYTQATSDAFADGRLNRLGEVARVGRIERYNRLMDQRVLRRQKLTLYLVTKIPAPRAISKDALEPLLKSAKSDFETAEGTLRMLFAGGSVESMDDADNYIAYLIHLNPSLRKTMAENSIPKEDMLKSFAPELSIQDNCWRSDILETSGTDSALKLDGNYVGIFNISRWPNYSFPGIIRYLTERNIQDYSIHVNIRQIPIEKEVRSREKLAKRLEGEASEGKRRSTVTAFNKNNKVIDDLSSGALFPFNVNYTILVWADSEEEYSTKRQVITQAITSMSGAQYYETSAPTASRNSWFETWPGWTGGSYKYREVYATQDYLASFLPISSSFVGEIDGAHALYDGPNYSVVGVKMFEGVTPKHSAVFGMTRGGKSAFAIDLLSQIQPIIEYFIIVEEGLSYGTFTKAMGEKPIIIRPEGDETLNYLDTNGLPLGGAQISAASALALNMVGSSGNDDTDNYRRSLISDCIKNLYNDNYTTWKNNNEEGFIDVAKEAIAIANYRKTLPQGRNTNMEAFAEWRELKEADPGQVQDYLSRINEDYALRYANDPATKIEVRNLVFSKFKPEEYPQHSALVEQMRYGIGEDHNDHDIKRIADQLATWSKDSENGKLFDGVTNVKVNGKVAHFELGYIPEANQKLKQLAAFLVSNYARQEVITKPRGIRKLAVFEELARFVDLPGGDKVVAEFYAQLAKFACGVMSITQQYSQFKHSRLRGTILGNSKNFFILKQQDKDDIEDLGDTIGLPPGTRESIRSFKLPQNMAANNRYSEINYFSVGGADPINGQLRHYATPEMLYIASSDGDVFDAREKELAGCENGDAIVDRVLELTGVQPTQENES